MSLMQLREKLKAVDTALGELQRSWLRAGNELSKANSLIDAIQGENRPNGRRASRGVRRRVNSGGGEEVMAEVTTEGLLPKTALSEHPPRPRRGRPRREVIEIAETGNSETVEAAS